MRNGGAAQHTSSAAAPIFPAFLWKEVPAGAQAGSGMFSVAPAESIAPAEPGRILLGKH